MHIKQMELAQHLLEMMDSLDLVQLVVITLHGTIQLYL